MNGRADSATAFLNPTVECLRDNHIASTFKAPTASFSSTGLQLDSTYIKTRMVNNPTYSVGSYIAEDGLNLSSRSYNIMMRRLDLQYFF